MRQVAAIRRNLQEDLREVGENRRLYWVIREQWDSFEKRLAGARGRLGVPRSIHSNRAMDMATLMLSLRCALPASSSPKTTSSTPLPWPLCDQELWDSDDTNNTASSILDLSPSNNTSNPFPHPPDSPNSPPPSA